MMKKYLFSCATLLLLTACATQKTHYRVGSGDYVEIESVHVEKGDGYYKIGKPYNIFGKMYYPKEDYSYVETGVASWYGEDFHDKLTANGETYDMHTMTAAHRTLPMPSIVKVTNLENGKAAIFRVNDRGPFAKDRIIDISKTGAQELGFHKQGTTKVKVEILPEESKALKDLFTNGGSKISKTVYKNAVRTTAVKRADIPEAQYLQPITTQSNYQPAAASLEPYYVQLGAFNSQAGAESLKNSMSSFNNIAVYPAKIGNGNFYRVRVGPYATKQAADEALEKVKTMGIYNAKTLQD